MVVEEFSQNTRVLKKNQVVNVLNEDISVVFIFFLFAVSGDVIAIGLF